ncbi:MAG: hypothetical protein ABSE86_22990, partial [Bryobacteraceae bacterium]
MTRLAGSSTVRCVREAAVSLALMILTLGWPSIVSGQDAKPAASTAPAPNVPAPSVDDMWNSLLQGAPAPASQDPALTPP